jgi:8-oxo-dGTP diphosphatase
MQRKADRPYIPTREVVSAGGVAFREGENGREAALIMTAAEGRWQLPKGLVDPGETPKEAALREVREEAGIDCEIIAPVETIQYWFISNRDGKRERIHKFVHFFAMRYISGSVEDHDHEVSEARWVSIGDAMGMLAFENEKSILVLAADIAAGTIGAVNS